VSTHGGEALPPIDEPRLPPVTQLAFVSLGLIIAGGIYIVSHLPKHVPLGPAFALLGASAVLMVGNLVALSRAPEFNWRAFFGVAKWAMLAYGIIAGMLEYVFVNDGTRGGELVVLTLSLAIFAVHVPLLIGFTVARYAGVGAEAGA
jgi:hypothetical protein